MDYDIPKSVEQCRVKLREEFEKEASCYRYRVIDKLVIKGQMELKENVEIWKQECHVTTYFKETVEPKPTDFFNQILSRS